MDKNKLKQFVDFTDKLLEYEENKWLREEFLEIIGKHMPDEEISKHPVISRINEYCIEEIMAKQAHDFYRDFCLPQIKEELIADYIKMEHEKRRDDFERFSLCMFQQIENIINYLLKNLGYIIIKGNRNDYAYSKYDRELKDYVRKESGKTIEHFIFATSENDKSDFSKYFNDEKFMYEWNFHHKLKGILYVFYFKARISWFLEFKNVFSAIENIYQIRNKNHRGSLNTDKQKKMSEEILNNKGKYYLVFYGILVDFIEKINIGFKYWMDKIDESAKEEKASEQ